MKQSQNLAIVPGADEFSPLLQVRFRAAYDLVYSALLTNIGRTSCQLYATTTQLYPGDEIQVWHGSVEFPVGTIRGVFGRITSIGFNRPIRRATMDQLLAADPDRRWECDFGTTLPFQSFKCFSFTADSTRPAQEQDGKLVALMSGQLVRDKRRPSTRKAVVLPARYRTETGDVAPVVISDLTPEGCCVSGSGLSLSPGETIVLRPQSLEELSATVRWVDEDRAGIQFAAPLYAPVAEHIQTAHAAFLSEHQRELLGKLTLGG